MKLKIQIRNSIHQIEYTTIYSNNSKQKLTMSNILNRKTKKAYME